MSNFKLTKQQQQIITDEYLQELKPSALDIIFASHILQFFDQDRKFPKTLSAIKTKSTV